VVELEENRGRLDVAGLGGLHAYVQEGVRTSLSPGDMACISVRPMDVRLSTDTQGDEAGNRLEGRVVERIFLGELAEYLIQVGESRWRVHTHSAQRFQIGAAVWASFARESATIVLDQ